MPGPSKKSRIHLFVDAARLKRARKILGTNSYEETVERVLDMTIAEHETNRRLARANERFIKSGIKIKDIYGRLPD